MLDLGKSRCYLNVDGNVLNRWTFASFSGEKSLLQTIISLNFVLHVEWWYLLWAAPHFNHWNMKKVSLETARRKSAVYTFFVQISFKFSPIKMTILRTLFRYYKNNISSFYFTSSREYIAYNGPKSLVVHPIAINTTGSMMCFAAVARDETIISTRKPDIMTFMSAIKKYEVQFLHSVMEWF